MQASNWSRESLAWLAGLLEGEGSFLFKKDHHLSIQLAMTDEDVVRQACLIAGLGRLYGPYKRDNDHKAVWAWHVHVASDTYALMVALYQWLGVRRRAKILECLKEYAQWQSVRGPLFGKESQGVNNSTAKLTQANVDEIKLAFNGVRFAPGVRGDLAAKFGVHADTITNVAHGRHYL